MPPIKLKGGEVYLYHDSNNVNKRNDWRCDGYGWSCEGCPKLPSKTPYLRKLYSKIHRSGNPRGSNQFVRHGYSLLERSELYLIHYIGDESAFQPSTRGNKNMINKITHGHAHLLWKKSEKMSKVILPVTSTKKMVTSNHNGPNKAFWIPVIWNKFRT